MSFKYKQVILMRSDLKMSVGKIATQAAHAAMRGFLMSYDIKQDVVEDWLEEGGKKVVLKVTSEEMLNQIIDKSRSAGIHVCTINDAGLTQIAPGSLTCACIGPDVSADIDLITGDLKLY